ncbi:MAG TPA: hypothetical protein PKV41_06550 [Candidatus Omnitrophota bacterium]|nr:hypothetical protein [Candidatus Omnitrophota bacterium]
MKRIGIAASKISKGNTILYNAYVVLISVLFSLFIFIVAGATVVFALAIIRYVGNEIIGVEFETSWQSILAVCMASLTVVVVLFNVFAILKNVRLPRIQD